MKNRDMPAKPTRVAFYEAKIEPVQTGHNEIIEYGLTKLEYAAIQIMAASIANPGEPLIHAWSVQDHANFAADAAHALFDELEQKDEQTRD